MNLSEKPTSSNHNQEQFNTMSKPKQEQDSTAFMNMLRTKAGIAGEPPMTNIETVINIKTEPNVSAEKLVWGEWAVDIDYDTRIKGTPKDIRLLAKKMLELVPEDE